MWTVTPASPAASDSSTTRTQREAYGACVAMPTNCSSGCGVGGRKWCNSGCLRAPLTSSSGTCTTYGASVSVSDTNTASISGRRIAVCLKAPETSLADRAGFASRRSPVATHSLAHCLASQHTELARGTPSSPHLAPPRTGSDSAVTASPWRCGGTSRSTGCDAHHRCRTRRPIAVGERCPRSGSTTGCAG